MFERSLKNGVALGAAASLLLTLPGCLDWGCEPKKPGPVTPTEEAKPVAAAPGAPMADDGSAVLVSMDGMPVVTEKSLEGEVEKLGASSPEFKEAMAFMGDQIRQMVADQLVLRAVIGKYIGDRGIDKQADYQQSLQCVIAHAKDSVNQQFFVKDIKTSVTDRDVHKYYDEEKDRFILSQGGRKTVGVRFTDEGVAKAFLRKVKAEGGDIAKAAQSEEDGVADQVRDFGLVHEDKIGIDPTLRTKVLAMKVPGTEMFKIDDKTFWVVHVSEEEEKKYRSFDDVKDQLRRILEERATAEASSKKLEELKEKYGVKDYREQPQALPGIEDLGELAAMQEAEAA